MRQIIESDLKLKWVSSEIVLVVIYEDSIF